MSIIKIDIADASLATYRISALIGNLNDYSLLSDGWVSY